MNVNVRYDTFMSDHFAVVVDCNLGIVRPKKQLLHTGINTKSRVTWGERKFDEIEMYHNLCNSEFRMVEFPPAFRTCCSRLCHDIEHKKILNNMYSDIVEVLSKAAELSHMGYRTGKKN